MCAEIHTDYTFSNLNTVLAASIRIKMEIGKIQEEGAYTIRISRAKRLLVGKNGDKQGDHGCRRSGVYDAINEERKDLPSEALKFVNT